MPSAQQLAVDRLASKTLATSPARTSDYALIAQLANRAFFSATVEDANFVATAQRLALDALRNARTDGVLNNRSTFVGAMRKLAIESGVGSAEAHSQSLTNLAGQKRLRLIYDMNVEGAQGFARRATALDETALNLYPAWQLVRLESRLHPRDWETIWQDKGGPEGTGMTALKTDPIWTAISRFGTPWPPFDFGSGMGVRDVPRHEAIALELLAPDEKLNPPELEDFNQGLEAELKPGAEDALKELFGDQIVIAEGRAKWLADAVTGFFANPPATPLQLGQSRAPQAAAHTLTLTPEATQKLKDPRSVEVALHAWRAPDSVTPSGANLAFHKNIAGELSFIVRLNADKTATPLEVRRG